MGKDVVAVEQKLEKVIPKEFKVDVHHWLIYMDVIPVWRVSQSVAAVLLKTCASLKIKLNSSHLLRYESGP
tara:strand:- start:35 stop:247 length:213 start_codon:yes stop_codon:yes gene_type:complete